MCDYTPLFHKVVITESDRIGICLTMPCYVYVKIRAEFSAGRITKLSVRYNLKSLL